MKPTYKKLTFYAPHGKAYVTTRELRWKSPDVVVPKGLRFNVSVPRWLTWLVDPHDERLLLAARAGALQAGILERRGSGRADGSGVV